MITSSSRESESEAMDEVDPIRRAMGPDLSKDILDPLLSAIGALVLMWGNVESALHLLVISAFNDAGGKAIEQEFPRQLARKVKFLRRCFKYLKAFRPFAVEGESLMGDLVKFGTIRHGIIHAFPSGFDAETGLVTFTNLDANREGHLVKVARHSVLELDQLCLELFPLSQRLRLMDDNVIHWREEHRAAFIKVALERGWKQEDAELKADQIWAVAFNEAHSVDYDPARMAEIDVAECERQAKPLDIP